MSNPPTDVKIEKVLSQPGEPWGGGDGKSKMRTYDEVLFADDNATRKTYVPENIELVDGETVRGRFNSEKGTWTIFDPDRPPPPRSSSTSTAGGGNDGDFNRRPDHPVQMARALHTASMALAPTIIEQMLTIGVVEQPKDTDAYKLLVEGVAAWVLSTYPEAVRAQAAKADAA